MKFNSVLVGLSFWCAMSIAEPKLNDLPWDAIYEFNEPNKCLEDWTLHEVGSRWDCKGGLLRSLSRSASIKNTRLPLRNGDFEFVISRSIERIDGGQGETGIWLRNSADPENGGMQRIRVVIEEQTQIKRTVLRIDEVRGSLPPIKLTTAPVILKNYRGRYLISLRGSRVTVYAEDRKIEVETSVKGEGPIHLRASGGEGGWTDYERLAIRRVIGKEKKVLARVPDTEAIFGCAVGWRQLRLEREDDELILAADSLRADYRWSEMPQESRAPRWKPEQLHLEYAYKRDQLQLKIDERGALVGRCKPTQTWFMVQERLSHDFSETRPSITALLTIRRPSEGRQSLNRQSHQ